MRPSAMLIEILYNVRERVKLKDIRLVESIHLFVYVGDTEGWKQGY